MANIDMNYIAGCGDIGRRLGKVLIEQGHQVDGFVHTETSQNLAAELGIQVQQIELAAQIHEKIQVSNAYLYYLAPPLASDRHDLGMQHFLKALTDQNQFPAKIVYISTTGVYGDCQGRWITEDEPLKPVAERSLRRLDAEQQLQSFCQRHELPLVILRVAGIYGPGKLPLARLKKRLPVIRADESPYTNRIHADDLVSVCIAAMEKGRNGEIFNVSDGQPGTMADYFSQIARRAGLPEPEQISLAEGESQLSEGMMSYMRESRRLDNSKMLNDLGLTLRYPDLQSGLDSCFADSIG